MTTLDFIQKDIARSRASGAKRVALSVLLGLVIVSFGWGARRDFVEAFLPEQLLPALVILLLVVVLPWVGSALRLGGLVIAVLGLSTLQPQTIESLQKFELSERFWPEAWHCLSLGLLTSLFSSLLMTSALHFLFPTPSRNVQRACALIAGLCGLSALTFHCMGALKSHILISHWGQVVLILPAAYGIQRLVFWMIMRRALGRNSRLQRLSGLNE